MRRDFVRILGCAAWVACLSAIPVAVLQAAPPGAGLMAESLTLPSGTVLRVWEVRARYMKDSGAESSWYLAYDVTDGTGSTSGLVGGTEDAAPDRTPRLILEPRSRTVALVWSRWDGVYQKIAYSRFESGAWTGMHYLSFGPGDDIEPRLARARNDAFVFWLSESKYIAAPLEISTGRLLAVPKPMPMRGAWTPALREDDRGVPNNAIVPPNGRSSPATPGGRLRDPGTGTVDGVADGPVHPNGHKASVWGVGSSGNCARMAVAAPDSEGSHLLIYRLTSGATTILIKSVDLPSPTPPHFAEISAAAALPAICN